MALCRVDQVPGIDAVEARLGSWTLGLALAAAILLAQTARRRPANPWVAFGVAVLSVPAWHILLLTLPDIVKTFCAEGNLNLVIVPGQVVPAESRVDISNQYIGSILSQVGYVGMGALLVWRGRDPAGWRAPRVTRIAHALRDLVPMGRGEAWSLGLGLALFPLLAFANLALGAATSGSGVRTGDDSHVFDNITLLQMVLLALAAGVGEELVYRGVIQQGLKRLVPGSRWGGLALGLGVQAVVFAYAHAGYQNLQHLLFAFLFAVLSGVLVEGLGLWCTIALHALVDLYAFGLSAAPTHPLVLPVLGALFFALVVFGLAWLWLALRDRLRRRAAPPAPPAPPPA